MLSYTALTVTAILVLAQGAPPLVSAAAAAVDLSKDCAGNLLINPGFEDPSTETVQTEIVEPSSNKYWAWLSKIPGWYTARPDGLGNCVKTDWCGTCLAVNKPMFEIWRGAIAPPAEGRQFAELLPNGTGNYCQDVQLQKGAQYKLSYYYGRLMNFQQGNKRINLDTAVDVAMRPASYTPNAASSGAWPGDKQGFTVISQADTADDWSKQQKQWVKHETTFTAPSDTVTIAFINAKRPKECGACGSLLDAVCLQKL